MDPYLFSVVVDRRLEATRRTLTAKGDEYAPKGDCLSNFKRAAATLRVPPEAALLGFVTKHWVAVQDFVDELASENGPRAYRFWEEKIGDIIAYMILLDALVQERLGGSEEARGLADLLRERRERAEANVVLEGLQHVPSEHVDQPGGPGPGGSVVPTGDGPGSSGPG